jgi:hypothetical protein
MEDDICTCEEDDIAPHSCPYAAEIGGDDSDDYCTCCAECEYECAVAI